MRDLRQLVEQNLSLFLYENAKFYAERLYYEHRTEENLHLLAQCYFRQGKTKQAYLILQQGRSLDDNRYLLATCCLALDKLEEAERALLPFPHCLPQNLTAATAAEVPGGASGLYLLGVICKRAHRKDAAKRYFRLALERDASQWGAVTELADMGEMIDMSKVFGIQLADALQALKTNDSRSRERKAAAAALSSRSRPFNAFNQMGAGMGVAGDAPDAHNASTLSAASMASISHKMDVTQSRLEHRRMAETASLGAEGSPAVSLSLGLSSSSLHIPFATPGSVPQGDFIASLRQSLSGGRSNRAQTAPYSAMSDVTGHSGRGIDVNESVMGMLHTQHSRDSNQQSHSHSHSHSQIGLRSALFDMDSPLTPGALPPNGRGGGDTSGPSAPYSYTGGTPAARYVDRRNTHVSSGGILGGTGGTGSTGDGSGEADAPRRVSFGPATTRLSFGSYGPARTPAEDITSNMDGSLGLGDTFGVGIGVDGPESGHEEFSPDDPGHPHKMQRLGLGSSGGRNHLGIAEVMSPIAVAHSPGMHLNRRGGDTLDDTAGIICNQNERPNLNSALMEGMSGAAASGKTTNTNIRPNSGAAQTGRGGGGEARIGAAGGGGNVAGAAHVPNAADPGDTVRLAALLVVLASGYQLLNLYRCRECIALLHKLPERHFGSAFVQHLLGRAYYEANDYRPSVLALKEMLRLEPFRLAGTETLSTALWHLKKDKELCALAQQVVQVDRQSPEAWCVVGNCFSLLREPEGAVRFFQRALDIDKYFTYAHTLCGHEAASNEDLDKAAQCFRQAILCDERHYSAWYGLGSIYKRQERYELAEFHLRKALQINAASGKLYCHLGMALHAQNSQSKNEEAYKVLTKACEVDANNPQLHFQRAHVLIATEQYQEALEELETVRELAPREPPVYVLMGQLCQKLGRNSEALLYYNVAIDLDPKEAAGLKKSMEDIAAPGDDLDSFEGISGESVEYQ